MERNAKATKASLGLGLMLIIVLATAALATAQELPALYYGGVQVIGPERTIDAPPGAVVAAFLGEDEKGSIGVIQQGVYGNPPYDYLIVPKRAEDYIPNGSTIEFRVNGFWANETYTFESGEIKQLDLTVNDNVAPASSVNAISPYWQTSTPFTITATASDVLSGVENVELYYRYSSDNSTWEIWTSFDVDTAAPWEWSFTAPLGDGYYEFYSIARDRVGNVEAAPDVADATCNITLPPPPATLTADTTPIKASVYVNNVLWGIAPQTRSVAAGGYTVSFGDFLGYLTPPSQTVTLSTGETRTVTGTYTEIPSELIENESSVNIPSITTDENVTIEVENTAITGMTIDVGENVENVRITVQQLTDKPAEIAIGVPGVTYCYLNIVAENITDADIDVVVINFRVEKAWVTAENIDPDTIALRRWDPVDEEWVSLPTTRIGEDDTYYYYSAESPGLSILAVSGLTLAPTPAELELSNLVIDPSEVGPGEEVTISVDVTNAGDLEGTYTVTLKIDNVVEATEDVTLAGEATETVTFTVSRDVEGTYSVEVDGLTGSFTVVAPPPTPPGIPWIAVSGVIVIAALLATLFYFRRIR